MNYFSRILRKFGTSSGDETYDRDRADSLTRVGKPKRDYEEYTPEKHETNLKHARYLVHNSGTTREIARDFVLYGIGDGILPQIDSGSEEWDKRAAALWKIWARKPEIRGMNSMRELQNFACTAIDTDGELFLLLIRDPETQWPKVQAIEAQDVRDDPDRMGETRNGIVVDSYGRPTYYRVLTATGYIDIPACSMIHIANYERVTSYRGRAELGHTVGPVSDVNEIEWLQKIKTRDEANIALALTMNQPDETGETFGFQNPAASGKKGSVQRADPRSIAETLGGRVISLGIGEKAEVLNSNNPGANTMQFMKHLENNAVRGTGLPPEIVFDTANIGGAGIRLVVGKADRAFSLRQTLIIEKMMERLWLHFMTCFIACGLLPPPPRECIDWIGIADWLTTRRITVDNGRDSAATREDIKLGIMPIEDAFGAQGLDPRVEIERRAKLYKRIKAMADKEKIPISSLFGAFTEQQPPAAP